MEGWLNAKPYKSRGIKKLNRLMEGKPEHKQKPKKTMNMNIRKQ